MLETTATLFGVNISCAGKIESGVSYCKGVPSADAEYTDWAAFIRTE